MSYDALNMEDTEQREPLLHAKHAKYFIRFVQLMPSRVAKHDSTRGSLLFFSISGLDILNSLNLLTPQMRENIIDWIYGCLVLPEEGERDCAGFQGSRSNVIKTDNAELLANARDFQMGHLAMTYSALCVLVTLGDDFSRLNRKSIVDGVAAVQCADGSFSACLDGSENDMRFVYCAAAVCYMLDYWGNVNKDKMFEFIKNSLRYDNGFSQHLEGEAHGGTTFCAIAALKLSNQLHRLDADTIEGVKRWLIFRQVNGFQGRPNKPVDTCYSFWIGAALRILDAFELTDNVPNRSYIMATQDKIVGGFSKWPESITDPFHTYFGLCGLAFTKEPGLADVMPTLNITMPAYRKLLQLHAKWQRDNSNDLFAKTAATMRVENETITSPLISAQ